MPTALCGFSGCLNLVAKRAQALPVPVVVLPTLPKRNDVVQLEGATCPWRYVHKPATVGTVRSIPEPYAEPCLLPYSATGPSSGANPRHLLQRASPHHLYSNRSSGYAWLTSTHGMRPSSPTNCIDISAPETKKPTEVGDGQSELARREKEKPRLFKPGLWN